MKKFLMLLGLLVALVGGRVQAEVRYAITSYTGDLVIAPDNTATYQQRLIYDFEDDFNGQYVTLGAAGRMPTGFAIDAEQTKVQAWRNGQVVEGIRHELEDLGDGYRLKIYNGGKAGDQVELVVVWQLHNLLYPYQDIAELNWVPISDWDVELGQVELTVTTAAPTQERDLKVHLGYFKDPAQVNDTGETYRITYDNLPAGDNLELHAYWGQDILYDLSDSDRLAQEGLADYQAVERKIAWKTTWANRLFFPIMPGLMLLFVLLAAVLYGLYLQHTRVKLRYDKKARLYEVPADLSPLLVASHVYGTEVLEASPIEGRHTQLTFENILQATLLDLIDRGLLTYETANHQIKKIWGQQTITTAFLAQTDQPGLSEAEQIFVNKAFNYQNRVAVEDLFSSFAISKDIMKGKKAADEAKVQAEGRAAERRFKTFLKALDKAVAQEIKAAGLPNNYRQLTEKEEGLIYGAMMVLIVGAALQLLPVFLLSVTFFWHFGLAVVMTVLVNLFFDARRRRDLRDGVLTEDGATVAYEWQAFRNMLRQIGKFNQAEVQGHLLWNRLLVYATLFGLADKVEAAMKLRKLRFDNESLNVYVSNAYHYRGMHTAMHSFANYATVANSASNFSVSTGSSGSGGFSGGGGGGGGGAF